ncbi:MAG: carboxypeptidase regulatory-like domain-containing protein, partial [Hyphomicrobiaceae bacterium]|nr:carboxypeptidase regulatory-like domain-containing protein [Hyphomicrobiaceae bacterium]
LGIDASNNNLTTDDRKFILGEGGTVTAKQMTETGNWIPVATNAQGVVVGAGTPGAIQYEMFIPVSELDTNFTNTSTIKFFMSRTHSASNPDVESYYPQGLINTTDATLWQSVLLSETPQYTYINNTTTPDYTVTGLDPFTWYQHKFVTINGTLESSAVNHVAITLDTPSYSISGYIVDIFGNFISNATVYAQDGYVSEMNTSNTSGYYSGVHFHNDTYNIYANATGYALNYTTVTVAGANLTNVNVTLTPLQIIPPDPTNLTNVTYNHGVGFNWTVGSGNVTDSYNVSYNGTWYNVTTNTFINKTVGAHGTAEIFVYAYNSTENGALSAGYLTDNVTVPNNAPVLTGIPDSNTNEDIPINDAFDLDTYYSDADGDSPSYSVQSNNQTGNITPSIDGNNVVSYSLAANWFGVAEIVYKVEDGYGGNDTDTVLVIVSSVNDPPVLQPIGPQNVNEGQTVTIEVAATDVETPEVDLDFTCNRTDLFTDFSINGGWTEWVTNYSQAGVYHVLFTVSDGTDSDNETVVITVTDIPFAIDSYWNNQTGNSLSLSIDTGTTVAFGVTTNRTANTTWYNHGVFAETDTNTTQANYTATFASAGTFYINASATDGIDQTANTTFTVEVSVPAVYYDVSGYVFDMNATAISGATVSNNQTAGTNVTNVSGYYILSLENGSVLITASASGYVSNTTVATVSGDTANQNITLVAFDYTNELIYNKLIELESDIEDLKSIIWVAPLLAAVVVISVIRKKIEEHE